MLHFISLGSGSSGNCYMLYTDNDALLIDAGIGIRALKKHLRDYGLSVPKINNILITHDHADHVKSVGSLSKDNQLPVYATRKVHVGICGNWCVKNKIAGSLARIIENNVSFTLVISRFLHLKFRMIVMIMSVIRLRQKELLSA